MMPIGVVLDSPVLDSVFACRNNRTHVRSDMNKCSWEVIDGFATPGEYARFLAWLQEQTAAGMVEEVPVQKKYAGKGFEENGLYVSVYPRLGN